MEVKYRKLSELKKLDNNPRKINKKQFDILCESLKNNKEYFEARPLILSNRTNELVIIAGNQRYDAAIKIGLKEVPTFLMDGLTEEKEKEIIIRDNVSSGEWDIDLLSSWSDMPLDDWGMDYIELVGNKKEQLKQEKKELIPYKKIHILISIDINNVGSIGHLIDELAKIQGVEIEQSANW